MRGGTRGFRSDSHVVSLNLSNAHFVTPHTAVVIICASFGMFYINKRFLKGFLKYSYLSFSYRGRFFSIQ